MLFDGVMMDETWGPTEERVRKKGLIQGGGGCTQRPESGVMMMITTTTMMMMRMDG